MLAVDVKTAGAAPGTHEGSLPSGKLSLQAEGCIGSGEGVLFGLASAARLE